MYEGFLETSVKYLWSEETTLKRSVTYFLDNYKWTFLSGLQLRFRQHFTRDVCVCVFVCKNMYASVIRVCACVPRPPLSLKRLSAGFDKG